MIVEPMARGHAYAGAMILQALSDLESLLGRGARDTLLRLGMTHGDRARAAIARAMAAGDDACARSEAHGLRGAVSPFGVPVLADLLRRFENGEAAVAAEIDAGIGDFVAACHAALAPAPIER